MKYVILIWELCSITIHSQAFCVLNWNKKTYLSGLTSAGFIFIDQWIPLLYFFTLSQALTIYSDIRILYLYIPLSRVLINYSPTTALLRQLISNLLFSSQGFTECKLPCCKLHSIFLTIFTLAPVWIFQIIFKCLTKWFYSYYLSKE